MLQAHQIYISFPFQKSNTFEEEFDTEKKKK